MSVLDPLASGVTPAVQRGPGITLYCAEGSFYSQLARLALEEKGLQYSTREVDLVQLEQARSPRGSSPAVVKY